MLPRLNSFWWRPQVIPRNQRDVLEWSKIVDSDGQAGKVEEGGDYNDREYGQDYQGRLPNVSHESLLEDLSIDNFLRTLPRPYQLLQT